MKTFYLVLLREGAELNSEYNKDKWGFVAKKKSERIIGWKMIKGFWLRK